MSKLQSYYYLHTHSQDFKHLISLMSTQAPRKRTRSEITGNDLLREVSEEKLKKKVIAQGENGREVQDVQQQSKETIKPKVHKKKHQDQEDVESPNDPLNDTEAERSTQIEKLKKDKKKKKTKNNDAQAKQEDHNAESKAKKEKKKRSKEEQDKQIKQEEEKEKQKKDKKKSKQERKQSREKSSSKKKKHKKDKKTEKNDDEAKEEDGDNQKSIEKESKSKHKKKKRAEEDDQSSNESEEKQESGKSKKKDEKSTERRGRKPQYIKRKKMSIFERQQIINKKWRIKKRSGYLNKMSNRAWGELRAGPYRMATKPSKEEQRRIIDALLGDGPKDKKKPEQPRQSKDGSQIKIEDNKQPVTQQEQLEKKQEESESEEEIKKSKKKKEKKQKKDRSDSSSEQKTKSKSKPKKKGKKNKQDQSDEEKPKASSKSKTKKKKNNDEDQVKEQAQDKPKKKKNVQPQAKIQQGAETKRSKKKNKGGDSDDSDSSDSDSDDDKRKVKNSKKKIKKQGQVRKPRAKPNKQQETEFTKEESQKIIDLFAMDGGNYPQMMKQLPGMRLKNVRLHLRKLFHRALDIITYQVQHVCGRKIKQWQQDEKVQIVRQLHRIRSSNRLLSEANVDFRQKMTALMRSYNDESYMETVNPGDIEALYRKIEAFVRGYNTINRSKRTTAASITESKNKEKEGRYKFSKEVTRKPIISGGHLLSKSVKSEYKEQASVIGDEEKLRGLVSQQKLVEEWNRDEEKTLCQLYVSNIEADQSICDKLKQKYGASLKWRDFQVLGRKIDQLIKFALIKLQNLTSRPYSRIQRKTQMDRKRTKMQEQLKKQGQDSLIQFYKAKLETTSMFLYDNEIFQKEEKLEFKHRIFKNLSLLERQIFGHIQSYKLKTALVRILIEEFPPEDQIEDAVKQAKKFTKWARVEERKSNISSIKSIFIGERGDYRSQNDSNEDSIMADIEKVMIIKPADEVRQAMSYKEESLIDEKSELFGTGSQRGHEKMPIEIDEEVVSDFQQPASVKSSLEMMEQVAPQQQEYKNLERLYATLNTNSQSSQK